MKILKILTCIFAITLCLSAFASCNDKDGEAESSEDVYYSVKFTMSEGGSLYTERQVKDGGKVAAPDAPERPGYIFDGWYNGTIPWSFDNNVKSDLTLSARWLSAEAVFEHTPTGDGETTVITKLKKSYSILRIPSVIGGYTVTGIGDGVFAEQSDQVVEEIIIPEEVTTIGADAFKECKNIQITVEGALESVGEFAFYGCNGLSSVRFKEGITTISAYAFAETAIDQAILPKTVTVIDENAFDGCSLLTSVAMSSENMKICNSAFWNTGVTVLYLYGTDAQVVELLDKGIAAQNDPILEIDDSKIYIYSAEAPTATTEFGGFWYLGENGKIRLWK